MRHCFLIFWYLIPLPAAAPPAEQLSSATSLHRSDMALYLACSSSSLQIKVWITASLESAPLSTETPTQRIHRLNSERNVPRASRGFCCKRSPPFLPPLPQKRLHAGWTKPLRGLRRVQPATRCADRHSASFTLSCRNT